MTPITAWSFPPLSIAQAVVRPKNSNRVSDEQLIFHKVALANFNMSLHLGSSSNSSKVISIVITVFIAWCFFRDVVFEAFFWVETM